MKKTLFEENQERLLLNQPRKPSNTTGSDVARALIYVGDCIIYLTKELANKREEEKGE